MHSCKKWRNTLSDSSVIQKWVMTDKWRQNQKQTGVYICRYVKGTLIIQLFIHKMFSVITFKI